MISLDAPRVLKLRQDCTATAIPSGDGVTLAAGLQIRIMQERPEGVMVLTEQGQMARIGSVFCFHSLGEQVAPHDYAGVLKIRETPIDKDAVYKAIRKVYDPEIPVNIVELGLIYGCEISPLPSGGSRVEVRMTLTAPGCSMSEVIKRQVEERVRALPGVDEVKVVIVFDPPWTKDRMSEAAKLELGLL